MTRKKSTESNSQRTVNKGPFIFIVSCVLFFGINELFMFHIDSAHIVTIEAKVTDKYIERRKHGARQRHYTIVFTYSIGDKVFYNRDAVLPGRESIWQQVKIGDCVEITVNTRHPELARWNEDRPAFHCRACE